MKKLSTMVIALALVLVVALVAYPRYRAARVLAERKQGIAQALAKDNAFTETLLKMELESPGVTYKELLDFCDKSIDQRNILIVEMRVGMTMLAPIVGSSILAFLNAENGFTRAKKSFLSASLELDTALRARADGLARSNAELERSKEATKRIIAGGQSEDRRSRDFQEMDEALAASKAYLDRLPLMAARVEEAAKEAHKSIEEFRTASEALKVKEKELSDVMLTSGIAFRPVFAPYYQQSIEKAHEAEKKVKL